MSYYKNFSELKKTLLLLLIMLLNRDGDLYITIYLHAYIKVFK